MIHVDKGEKPTVLQENETSWTQEYLKARNSGNPVSPSIRFRYRHPTIKSALVQESHGKCIYCERKVATGETDHVRPVSQRPDQVFIWENLGFVCKECNMYKSDYYDESEPLLNPFPLHSAHRGCRTKKDLRALFHLRPYSTLDQAGRAAFSRRVSSRLCSWQ